MLLSKSHATLKAPCYSQSPMLLSKSHATLKVPCYSQSPMLLWATLNINWRGRTRAPKQNLGISKSIQQGGQDCLWQPFWGHFGNHFSTKRSRGSRQSRFRGTKMLPRGLPGETWAWEGMHRGSQRRAGRAQSEYSKDFWIQSDVKVTPPKASFWGLLEL